MNYYISDLHLSHFNSVRFDNRPFANTKEMDETLINNWNSVVKKGDCVYILGDFCWNRDPKVWISILKKLNGMKFLIKGNHDIKKMPPELTKRFAQICDYKEVHDMGRRVCLSHYPMLFYRSDYSEKTYMLYGHVHNSKEYDLVEECRKLIESKPDDFWGTTPKNTLKLYNVGCMMPWMNFTPRTLDEIIEGYNLYNDTEV